MTTVRATRFVNCPFSGVIEFAEEALRERESITLSPAAPFKQRVALATEAAEDISDRVRRHDALLIAWKPAIAFLFPDFRGAVTVRPMGHGAWLRIQGSYEPPLGAIGRVFDALFGRYVAHLTLAHLLDDVARDVECRWRAYRKEIAV